MTKTAEETLEELKEDMRQEVRDFGVKEVRKRIAQHETKYLRKKEWVSKRPPSEAKDKEMQNLTFAITEINLFKGVLKEFTGAKK